jgi:4-amino-4-deoxy-L-arabinose transferase-like glycosyltransferase
MHTLALPRPRPRSRGAVAVVALLAITYAVLWGGGLALSRISPPLDTAEQFAWVYALQGGYPKHPPLVTWILHGLLAVFGTSISLPFFATFACIALALALSWRLASEFMTPERALLGLGLSALVGYYNFNADAYNHNVVMMPFQAGLALSFWFAVRRGGWHRWALTGLVAGLAMLVKYVAVFPLAAMLLYVLLDPAARVRRTFLGLLLAGAVAATVFAPHLLWLDTHDWMPLRYMESVTAPVSDPVELASIIYGFFVLQFLRLLPALALFGWLLLRGRRAAVQALPELARNDRLYLWCVAVGPLAIEVLYGVVMRTPMAGRWGSTMFLLTGWLLLDLARHRPLPDARVAWRNLLVVHAVSWGMTILVTPVGAALLHLHGRANYPGAELASRAEATWQARTGRPLRILIADVWTAGNVIAHTAPAAVMVDGRLQWSPWITEQDVEQCGALVLQNRTIPEGPPPATDAWMDRAGDQGIWMIPWDAAHPSGEPERIQWGVLRPKPGAGCRL